MAITGALGAKLYIVDSILPDSLLDSEEVGDFAFWSTTNPIFEIGLVENLNEMGRVYETVSFSSYQTGKSIKYKVGYDEGEVQFILGQDLADAGQVVIRNGYNSFNQNSYQDSYLFKIIIPGFELYFGAKILTFRTQIGNVNSVIRSILNLSFSTKLCITENVESQFESGPYMYIIPTSGATVTVPIDIVALIMDPAGTLATLGVTLPPTPGDGDVMEINTSKTITALTVTAPGGASVLGGVQMLAANGGIGWRYRSANTTWYRRF